MTGSTQRVGRITVAIGLVLFGAALLVDNLTGIQSYTSLVIRLWPLLLVGFGAEYLVRSILSSWQGAHDVRLRFDIGGAIMLVLVAMLSVGLVSFRSWNISPGFAFGFGPSESKTESRTVSGAGVKMLQADLPVGTVRLEPNVRSDEIRIEATYSTRGFPVNRQDTRRQLDQIKLNVTEGETVKVTAEMPPSQSDVTIRFVIYAPSGLKVQADAGAGSLEVLGYKGDIQLTTRVGRVNVDSASGSLSATSSSGFITVQGFTGPVTAKTNVGGIEVQHQNGPLQLESGTGSINVAEFHGGRLVAENQMGGIHVATQSPLEGDVLLKSQTGQVDLKIPKESSIRVTAQIKSGSLVVPDFVTTNRAGAGETAVGTSGDGQYTVSLEANTGSVQLNLD